MGRLLVARNRCHAALLAEQQAAGAGSVPTEAEAARRVGAWVDAHYGAQAAGGVSWAGLRKARAWARTDWRQPNASTAALLAQCAVRRTCTRARTRPPAGYPRASRT